MAGIIHFSEVEVFASIEVYQRTLVEVLISGLYQIRLRLQISILRLIELRDGRLASLVFGLHQLKGILRTLHGLQRCLFLRLRIQGIVIDLLDVLIERLLRIFKSQLLVLLIDTGITDVVTRLETVEDWHVQVQTDILTEVVLQLSTESIALEAAGGLIVGTQPTAQRECGEIACLGHLDTMLRTLQLQFLGKDLRLDTQCLSIDLIGGDQF